MKLEPSVLSLWVDKVQLSEGLGQDVEMLLGCSELIMMALCADSLEASLFRSKKMPDPLGSGKKKEWVC